MTEMQLRTYAVTIVGPTILLVWSLVHSWT